MFKEAAIKRILKAKTDKRISENSVKLLNEILTKISEEIAFGAVKLTHLKGHKTIQKDVINLSAKQFLGRKINTENVKELPKTIMRKILINAGARRVSVEAIDLMNEIITQILEDIIFKAAKLTHDMNKKTIQKETIKLSTQQFLEIETNKEEFTNKEGK